MKKLAIIGLLTVIAVAGVVLPWHHEKISKARDDAFRERLAGVWLREEGNLPGMPVSLRCTKTVAADGSFVELSWMGHPHHTNTYTCTGTWLVADGFLIETVQSSSNPVEVTPHTGAARIVHADASGFTVRWPNAVETVWKKVSQ